MIICTVFKYRIISRFTFVAFKVHLSPSLKPKRRVRTALGFGRHPTAFSIATGGT